MSTHGIYVKDANGFYEEKQDPDTGEVYYEPAPKGMKFTELLEGSGRYVSVQDAAELARQKESTSHLAMFAEIEKDPRLQKQRVKRQEALQKQFQQMAIDRASPVGVPYIKYVTDEQFMDMLESYKKADAQGEGKMHPFQPLSTYAHKLVTSTGKVIRPLYQGEVGVMDDGRTTVCLEPGYGGGNSAQVKADIGPQEG